MSNETSKFLKLLQTANPLVKKQRTLNPAYQTTCEFSNKTLKHFMLITAQIGFKNFQAYLLHIPFCKNWSRLSKLFQLCAFEIL